MHRSGPPIPQQPRPPAVGVEKTGTINSVECPWCRRPQDFRPMVGADLGGTGDGNAGFEVGAVFTCDGCKRPYQIADYRRTVVVKLTPVKLPPRRR